MSDADQNQNIVKKKAFPVSRWLMWGILFIMVSMIFYMEVRKWTSTTRTAILVTSAIMLSGLVLRIGIHYLVKGSGIGSDEDVIPDRESEMSEFSEPVENREYSFKYGKRIVLVLGIAVFGFISFFCAYVALYPDESVDVFMTIFMWMFCVLTIIMVLYCIKALVNSRFTYVVSEEGLERRGREGESNFIKWQDAQQVTRLAESAIVIGSTDRIQIPYYIESMDELLDTIFRRLAPPNSVVILEYPLEGYLAVSALISIITIAGVTIIMSRPVYSIAVLPLVTFLSVFGLLRLRKIEKSDDCFIFHYLFLKKKLPFDAIRKIEVKIGTGFGNWSQNNTPGFDQVVIVRKNGFNLRIQYFSAGIPRLMEFLGQGTGVGDCDK